jgi:hypothetical protein
MNTWRDACELQQRSLNLLLKDFPSKNSVVYLTNDDFFKDMHEPFCNIKPNFLYFNKFSSFITLRPASRLERVCKRLGTPDINTSRPALGSTQVGAGVVSSGNLPVCEAGHSSPSNVDVK